jgi:arylsulfatase A-like enzyme
VMNGKHQINEHTIRVLFFDPGRGCTVGTKIMDVVEAMVDILPTLLDLAGSPVPATDPGVDSRSFAPRLLEIAR